MAKFSRFNYKTVDELREKIAELNLDIELTSDLSPLARRVKIGGYELPNSLAINPMEGCDGTEGGSPSDLTIRRYKRFAAGGAGLLWFEATAVVPEGRANPRQLYINRDNVSAFKEMLDIARQEGREAMGAGHRPLCILQLTHSGRYSKPYGQPRPVIAFHDPYLDSRAGVSPEQAPITDEELEQLQDSYVEAAILAREAGFDGVDIKACHHYLLSELLAGHTRTGKYGGDFHNRTRFLLETITKVRARVGEDFIIAVRLNAYDAHPYPYGWGVDSQDFTRPDLTEPIRLVHLLKENGVALVSISAGNPYYIRTEVTRPFDTPVRGAGLPDEHPLESVARLFNITRAIQEAEPELAVMGSGYSWLRQFFGQAAAANIARGAVTLAGAGRLAFAYPDFARDLLTRGHLDERKVCIACSRCTQIMRDGGRTGCVIRDAEVYLPIYKSVSNAS
ncbi:NADH:flavin oxidoreductase [Neomoorella thermoacetica]|uniref:oxidoreductase n=1 Tax=Neomoorella thermoacetica TaxID=1525 RepID=UPI0008FB8BF4|nr:NADH:flavin oxidoreductase [Moorella thermoacetica]APC08995.1 NADPH dehydrogenase [Moorella thermoacetica]